jgi:hypothetical protein
LGGAGRANGPRIALRLSQVSLEIDDEGALFWLFSRPGERRNTFGKRYRVELEGRVRVLDAIEPGAEGETDESRQRQRS